MLQLSDILAWPASICLTSSVKLLYSRGSLKFQAQLEHCFLAPLPYLCSTSLSDSHRPYTLNSKRNYTLCFRVSTQNVGGYSQFTNDMQWFSANISKITKPTVLLPFGVLHQTVSCTSCVYPHSLWVSTRPK